MADELRTGDDDMSANPIGSESSVVNRRDIPGGSFRPALTPGALGPTTREIDRAGPRDSLLGRTVRAGELQEKPKAPSA
jgi:hypothetical protein